MTRRTLLKLFGMALALALAVFLFPHRHPVPPLAGATVQFELVDFENHPLSKLTLSIRPLDLKTGKPTGDWVKKSTGSGKFSIPHLTGLYQVRVPSHNADFKILIPEGTTGTVAAIDYLVTTFGDGSVDWRPWTAVAAEHVK